MIGVTFELWTLDFDSFLQSKVPIQNRKWVRAGIAIK
jgi:hypothetical protein